MKTAIVADDSLIMRSVIKNMLSALGYNVIGEAESGERAVQMYSELKPDIMTMDIVMGNMSGVEALRQIIEIDADAKVVMISSMSQKPIIQDAISSGAKGFLVKPFDTHQVTTLLNRLADS
jgi:two-component system chemotaxis response regulator CheY